MTTERDSENTWKELIQFLCSTFDYFIFSVKTFPPNVSADNKNLYTLSHTEITIRILAKQM